MILLPLEEGSFFAPCLNLIFSAYEKNQVAEGGRIAGRTLRAKEGEIISKGDGGAAMRVKITLSCTECKQRNYNTMKNKKNTPDRLEMSKYCRFCRKHTVHRETK